VGADANIAQLQTFVSGNAALSSNLAKLGHGPADVIGADRQGNTLILYVI
jgi:hypothetical protein